MAEELKNFANIGIIRSQSGCTLTSHSASGIDLREKNIVYPTERSENATAISKLAEEDIRSSMKMMPVPDQDLQAARLNFRVLIKVSD